MKVRLPNAAVLFLILTVQQSSIIEVSSVPEGLEKLVIETRNYDPDVFTLHFKKGFKCTQKKPSEWCGSLNAYLWSTAEGKRICSCACQSEFRTFIPEEQMCVNSTRAKHFAGKYLTVRRLLLAYFKLTRQTRPA